MIPVYKPYLPANSLRYAHEALNSGWLSHGPYLEKTTSKLKEILGVKNLLLVSNGTTANHLLVRAAHKFYPSINRVLVPDNTYIAAINSWLFDNQPYQIDVCPPSLDTWNFDCSEFEAWAKNLTHPAFVFAVHNLGNIVPVPVLQKKYPNLFFLEDNCEGLFGSYEEKFSGTSAIGSSISFFGNKNITCGEGGALILRDAEMLEYLSCLHGQGQSKTRFLHSELGYNYRMTNIQAAILYGQLEIVSEIKERKEEIFSRYRTFVNDNKKISTQKIEQNTEHSNWMFGVHLDSLNPEINNYPKIEKYFFDRKIEIRPMFYPLTEQPSLKNYFDAQNNQLNPRINFISDSKKAKTLHHTSFILPSYPGLTPEEQKHILNVLSLFLEELR